MPLLCSSQYKMKLKEWYDKKVTDDSAGGKNEMVSNKIGFDEWRRVLDRQDISGKTGTTNGPRDAWFSGFNRDLITTAWVGFDDYGPLGRREFGGTAALPIWIDYMRRALPPAQPAPPMPPGIVRLRVDRESGLRVRGQPKGSVMEYFLEESLPDWDTDSGSAIDTENLEQIF